MFNRKKYSGMFSPYLAWGELAVKANELMFASSLVIQQRVSQMAAAGLMPSAKDRKEMMRMGSEKIEAINESGQAMLLQCMAMNPLVGWRAFDSLMSSSRDMMSLAAKHNGGQSLNGHSNLTDVMMQSTHATAELVNSAAKVVEHGMAPFHKRVTANSRRLSRS
jgi:hypothetical protein